MDLAITAYVLTCCAAVLFRIGLRFGAMYPVASQLWLTLGMSVTVWMAWNCGSSLRWAQLVPHSYVLLLANAFVILVIGAAGLLAGSRCLSLRSQNWAVAGLCFAAACYVGAAVLRPLWQPLRLDVPVKWNDVVCMQSHEASCAPAAAATLLGLHGVQRSETEMATACLTSNRGTLALGTFRGLCLAAHGTSISPRALVCKPETYPKTELEQRLPMLVHINLRSYENRNPSNFVSGNEGHAVVVVEKLTDGDWLIADPAVGKVHWQDDYFRSAWNGEGIYLVSR